MDQNQVVQLSLPLIAVLLGGILTIGGSYFTTVLLEHRQQRQEQRRLAYAFRGEISAILDQIQDRQYIDRISDIIDTIKKTNEPYLMPFQARYEYANVYKGNVNKIGMLEVPLPERIPIFYTQLTSVLEDLVNIGDGPYSGRDIESLIRIYEEIQRILTRIVKLGQGIIVEIDRQYADT